MNALRNILAVCGTAAALGGAATAGHAAAINLPLPPAAAVTASTFAFCPESGHSTPSGSTAGDNTSASDAAIINAAYQQQQQQQRRQRDADNDKSTNDSRDGSWVNSDFDNKDARGDSTRDGDNSRSTSSWDRVEGGPDLLADLEGVWTVEVEVNPAYWSREIARREANMRDRRMNDGRTTRDASNTSNDSETVAAREHDEHNQHREPDGERPHWQENNLPDDGTVHADGHTHNGVRHTDTERDAASREPASRTEPDSMNADRRNGDQANDMVRAPITLYGTTRNELVLDGSILRERTIIRQVSSTRDFGRAGDTAYDPNANDRRNNADARDRADRDVTNTRRNTATRDANNTRTDDARDRSMDTDDRPATDGVRNERRGERWTNADSANPVEGMEGLAYFSFDENAAEYDAVFMSSMDGSMHHARGAYDATNNRIVFTDGADKNNPATRVVLERLDDDRFVVVMCQGPSNGDNTDLRTRDSDGKTRSWNQLPDNVVYRAVYTRSGADATRDTDRRTWNEDRDDTGRDREPDRSNENRSRRSPRGG